MRIDQPRSGPFYRALRSIIATRAGIWLFSPTLRILDRAVLLLSGGKATLAGILGGAPIITLTTTGSRSGKPHSVPVLGIPAGEGIVVVASNWGRPRNPSWYSNLKANPRVAVTYRNRTGLYAARELDGEERDGYWTEVVHVHHGYDVYQRRCPSRKIPVIMLHPMGTLSGGIRAT